MKAFFVFLAALACVQLASCVTTVVTNVELLEAAGHIFGNNVTNRAFIRAVTGIEIQYDFYCKNNDGRYVSLRPNADNSYITVAGLNSLSVTATVRNTPEQDHHGHGNATGGENFNSAQLAAAWTIPNKIAAFRKGGGKPDAWNASTGNPYIYFSPDNNGWTCECIEDQDCESPAENVGKPNQVEPGCCTFQGNYQMLNGPLGKNNNGRSRKPGDIYVGRCNEWLSEETDTPSFTIKCSADAATAQASLSTYPTCGSVGHNIGIGLGMDIVDHHKITASQVSATKFLSCPVGSDKCTGAGPHEVYDDDTCMNSPPLGGLIDKSAGNTQTDDNQGGFTCGENLPPRRSTRADDFSACGVGGNPCLTEFTCILDGGSCFSSSSEFSGNDVIDALGLECAGDSFKCGDAPDAEGCRCSTIRSVTTKEIETDCYSSSN